MSKNNTLKNFGFISKQFGDQPPAPAPETAPNTSNPELMEIGDPQETKTEETEMETTETSPSTVEFPNFLLNGKPLLALHGIPLNILITLVDIPRIGQYNDEEWRFILCKSMAMDPELLFLADCQIQFLHEENPITHILNEEISIYIRDAIWDMEKLKSDSPNNATKLELVWTNYSQLLANGKKATQDKDLEYINACSSKQINSGHVRYSIKVAESAQPHLQLGVLAAQEIPDYNQKLAQLTIHVDNEGKFLLYGQSTNVELADIKYGGYLIITKYLMGSNAPIECNKDILSNLIAKFNWFDKTLAPKIKKVIGWLRVAKEDKPFHEITQSNQHLDFELEDLRKCNKLNMGPPINIFVPFEDGFILTSPNITIHRSLTRDEIGTVIQESFKLLLDDAHIGILDGPGLIDPYLPTQLTASLTENILKSFINKAKDSSSYKDNMEKQTHRLLVPINTDREYNYALITGVPLYLIEDKLSLLNEINSIADQHPSLQLVPEHISALLAQDKSTWAHPLGGNRYGILLSLPSPTHNTNSFHSGIIAMDKGRHRYLLSLLTPAEASHLTSGQLHIMSIWRNLGSHTLLARGRSLIQDLLNSLLPGAFTAIPHLIQHSLSTSAKTKVKDDRKPQRHDELLVVVIANNSSVCRRGRTLLQPAFGMDNKPVYIEIALWPFEVHFLADSVMNKKFLFPNSLTTNIKTLHINYSAPTTYKVTMGILNSFSIIDSILFLIPPLSDINNCTWMAALPPAFDEDQLDPAILNRLRSQSTTITFTYQLNNVSDSPLFDHSKKDVTLASCYDSWLEPISSLTPQKLTFKPWSGFTPSSVKNAPKITNGPGASTISSLTTRSSAPSTSKTPNIIELNGLSQHFTALQAVLVETKDFIKAGAEDRFLLRTLTQDLAATSKHHEEARIQDKKEAAELRARETKAAADASNRREELFLRVLSETMESSFEAHGIAKKKTRSQTSKDRE